MEEGAKVVLIIIVGVIAIAIACAQSSSVVKTFIAATAAGICTKIWKA